MPGENTCASPVVIWLWSLAAAALPTQELKVRTPAAVRRETVLVAVTIISLTLYV